MKNETKSTKKGGRVNKAKGGGVGGGAKLQG